MWKTVLVVVYAGLLSNDSYSQTLRRPMAAQYTGFGAYSVHHLDVFSFTSNQASLAQVKNIAAGLFAERRFLLAELNNYTAAVAVPTKSGNFGLKANYTGFTDYNETQLGLSYGRRLGTKADVGIQFNYNSIRASGYGSSSALSFEIGTVFHLSEKLHTGFQVSNPIGGKFGTEKQEKLPSVYSAGIGYDASEKFLISMEMQKEEDQPVNVNAGLQYRPINSLSVRAGISSATSSLWGGVGVFLQSFRIDITASFHPQLGLTPGMMIVFGQNSKKD